MNYEERRAIYNLYKNWVSAIKLEDEKVALVKKGLRQICSYTETQ